MLNVYWTAGYRPNTCDTCGSQSTNTFVSFMHAMYGGDTMRSLGFHKNNLWTWPLFFVWQHNSINHENLRTQPSKLQFHFLPYNNFFKDFKNGFFTINSVFCLISFILSVLDKNICFFIWERERKNDWPSQILPWWLN